MIVKTEKCYVVNSEMSIMQIKVLRRKKRNKESGGKKE